MQLEESEKRQKYCAILAKLKSLYFCSTKKMSSLVHWVQVLYTKAGSIRFLNKHSHVS